MSTESCTISLNTTLLRHFSLSKQGSPIDIKSQKARAILAYLLLNGTGYETRERIADLLWSEVGADKARMSLRQVIRSLNTSVNSPQFTAFHAGRNEISIDTGMFKVDILDIFQKIELGETHDLLLTSKRIVETLLADFDDLDAEFRVWLVIQRQTLHDRIVGKLEEKLSASGQRLVEIKRTCQALLNLDPTHEGACQHLMRIYAKEGDIASALRVYKSLWNILDEEYGMEPSPAIQELAAALKLGKLSEQQTMVEDAMASAESQIPIGQVIASLSSKPFVVARERKQKLIIAVEPFDIVGVTGDNSHIIQGFRHELIACLVRFRDWAVVDLNTTRSVDVQNPGLAQYTISMTVYQHNGALMLVLTLLENATGEYIWSDKFDLRLDSWFLVQHSIVRRMALALNVNLSAERLVRAAGKADVSLEIYDRWLRAEALLGSFKGESHRQAAIILRSIIETTPGFPDAYFSLVVIENTRHLVNPGVLRSLSLLQEGLALAKTAVQLDPLDSHGHLCLAWSLAMIGQYEHAAYSYAYACDLNENDPWTLISSAHGLASCGQQEQALKLANQSASLNLQPSPAHWGYQSIIRFLSGDYEASIVAAERADNTPLTVPAWKTAALYHLNRRSEAATEAASLIDLIRHCWAASSEPDALAITRWLLQCTPLKRSADWYRLQQGLQGAGLPVPEKPEF